MIHRIRGDLLDSWGRYQDWENRVIQTAQEFNVPMHELIMRAELRNRWFNTPVSSGYWIVTAGGFNHVVGHIASWLTVSAGTLSLFFFQLIGEFTVEQRRTWVNEHLVKWIDEIDALAGKLNYIPNIAPVVQCEFLTTRDTEVWNEYLERLGFEVQPAMSFVQFRRKKEPQRVVLPANGGAPKLILPN